MAASIDIGKQRRRPNFTDEELFAMSDRQYNLLLGHYYY